MPHRANTATSSAVPVIAVDVVVADDGDALVAPARLEQPRHRGLHPVQQERIVEMRRSTARGNGRALSPSSAPRRASSGA